MTIAEVLEGAANYIEEHGWQQGHAGVPGGPRCLAGAIHSAIGVEPVHHGLVDLLPKEFRSALNAVGKQTQTSPVLWNDLPGRTKEQVIDALRAAAKEAA